MEPLPSSSELRALSQQVWNPAELWELFATRGYLPMSWATGEERLWGMPGNARTHPHYNVDCVTFLTQQERVTQAEALWREILGIRCPAHKALGAPPHWVRLGSDPLRENQREVVSLTGDVHARKAEAALVALGFGMSPDPRLRRKSVLYFGGLY